MAGSCSAPEWRAVQDFPDYEVSRAGVVRRLIASRRKPKHFPAGYVLSQSWTVSKSGKGYFIVKLSHGIHHRLKQVYVNRIVCEAFHGAPPSAGHQAAHADGNTKDNSSANLRWATPYENQRDRDRHGTNNVGERHGRAKLTEASVADALSRLLAGHKAKDIARDLGVSLTAIYALKHNKTWTHIERHGH